MLTPLRGAGDQIPGFRADPLKNSAATKLKEISAIVGKDALQRIDECIVEWKYEIAIRPKIGFFKKLFTSDKNLFITDKEVMEASKEIKHLNKLKKEIASLQNDLKKTKAEESLPKIEKISNEILLKARKVLESDKKLIPDDVIDFIFPDIESGVENDTDVPIDTELHISMQYQDNSELNTDFEKNIENASKITERLNNNYRTKIQEVIEVLKNSSEELYENEYQKMEDEDDPKYSSSPDSSFDKILYKLTNKISILISKISELEKIDDASLGALDPLKVCAKVEAELNEIMNVYKIEKGKSELQVKLRASGMPNDMEKHWQSELNKIKSDAGNSYLIAIEELTEKFDRFFEIAAKHNKLSANNDITLLQITLSLVQPPYIHLPDKINNNLKNEFVKQKEITLNPNTEKFQFAAAVEAIKDLQNKCDIILKASEYIKDIEKELGTDYEENNPMIVKEENETMNVSKYLSKKLPPNISKKHEEMLMKSFNNNQQEYKKITKQKMHIKSLMGKAKTKTDFEEVEILSGALRYESAKLLDRVKIDEALENAVEKIYNKARLTPGNTGNQMIAFLQIRAEFLKKKQLGSILFNAELSIKLLDEIIKPWLECEKNYDQAINGNLSKGDFFKPVVKELKMQKNKLEILLYNSLNDLGNQYVGDGDIDKYNRNLMIAQQTYNQNITNLIGDGSMQTKLQ